MFSVLLMYMTILFLEIQRLLLLLLNNNYMNFKNFYYYDILNNETK